MKIPFIVGLLAGCFSMNVWCQGLSIPEGVLLSSGIDTIFVAKFALFIALLLIGTTLCGTVFKKLLGLPVIAGQIIGGILLGPSLLDIRGIPYFAEPQHFIDQATGRLYALASSDLFIFVVLLLSSTFTVSYLLWIAGHETDIKDILKVGATASVAGFFGAVIPVAMTVVGGYALGGEFDLVRSIGLGLAFAATSVSIPIAMFFSHNKMHLNTSKATLGAAIIDDILAVILLSIFSICLQTGTFGIVEGFVAPTHSAGILDALFYMGISFIVIFFAGYFIIPPFVSMLKKQQKSHLIPTAAHSTMLIYFSFAELVGGLAGITGSYFAGLFHRMGDVRHKAERVISPFVNTLLLPLFFGSIGLRVDLSLLSGYAWLLVGFFLVIAIVSKLVACYLAIFLSNLCRREGARKWTMLEGFLFGSSMVARGEVGLVVATVLSSIRLITQEQYIMCVVVIVLSTIAAPVMLALGFERLDAKKRKDAREEFTVNLGLFDTIGTVQMFNIIVGRISARNRLQASITISEGRKVVNLEGQNVKLILCPEEGILFRGDREKIEQLLHSVKSSVLHDVERLPDGHLAEQGVH